MSPARLLALCAALSLAAGRPAASDGSRATGGGEETDVSLRAAEMAARGLAYLAENQNEDKSFSVERGEEVTARAPVAVTALSALAFMAGGSTLGRGEYQSEVRGAIEWLLDHTVEKQFGDEVGVYFTVDSDTASRMHGHGFATLAVAQAYGALHVDPVYGDLAEEKAREDKARIKAALSGAVRLIELTQTNQGNDLAPRGGWYYEPANLESDEGSITIAMIQALRAAHNAGIKVDKRVVDKAVRYVRDSQKTDNGPLNGGFQYSLTLSGQQRVSYALTAAAIATLNATGDYDSSVIDAGIEFMKRRDPLFNPDRGAEDQAFPCYGRLYAAQAYYMFRDPELWNRWQPLVVDALARLQNPSTGHFGGDEYGKVYATAMSCLVLELPLQYLPIFQR